MAQADDVPAAPSPCPRANGAQWFRSLQGNAAKKVARIVLFQMRVSPERGTASGTDCASSEWPISGAMPTLRQVRAAGRLGPSLIEARPIASLCRDADDRIGACAADAPLSGQGQILPRNKNYTEISMICMYHRGLSVARRQVENRAVTQHHRGIAPCVRQWLVLWARRSLLVRPDLARTGSWIKSFRGCQREPCLKLGIFGALAQPWAKQRGGAWPSQS